MRSRGIARAARIASSARPSAGTPACGLLLLLAEKQPERFDRAAARWHARFVLETRAVGVAVPNSSSVPSPASTDVVLRVQLGTIALLAERYKVSSVARVARRRLDRG